MIQRPRLGIKDLPSQFCSTGHVFSQGREEGTQTALSLSLRWEGVNDTDPTYVTNAGSLISVLPGPILRAVLYNLRIFPCGKFYQY